MVCYSLHEVKNKCIYFQWKKNTGLLAEVSSFSAKSLLRVIVALNWYCSTHSICSNLRTIDFQMLADSYSALKWVFIRFYAYWAVKYNIQVKVILDQLFSDDSYLKFHPWLLLFHPCYCLILQTGVVFECNSAGSWAAHLDFLCVETKTWDSFSVSLTQSFSADVMRGCQRWLEMAMTDTRQLEVSSQLPQVTVATLYWNLESYAQYRSYRRKWFFLS